MSILESGGIYLMKRSMVTAGIIFIVIFLSGGELYGGMRLQVGAFREEDNVQARRIEMEELGVEVELEERPGGTTGVRTAVLESEELREVKELLREEEIGYFEVVEEIEVREVEEPERRAGKPLTEEELRSRINGVRGVPYRWGGEGPEEGFDCSGLVNWVFDEPEMPRTVVELDEWSEEIEAEELEPGDLIFFQFNRVEEADHIGVYLGESEFVHASRSYGVIVVSRDREYYEERTVGFGRIPGR